MTYLIVQTAFPLTTFYPRLRKGGPEEAKIRAALTGGKQQSTMCEASSSPFLSLYETSSLDKIHTVGGGTENSPWLVCILPGNWKSRSQKESVSVTVLFMALNNRGAASPGHHPVNKTIGPFRGSRNALVAFPGPV